MTKKTHSKRADRILAREAKAYRIGALLPKSLEYRAQEYRRIRKFNASKSKPEFF